MWEEWPPIPRCRTVSTTLKSVSRLEEYPPPKSAFQTSCYCVKNHSWKRLHHPKSFSSVNILVDLEKGCVNFLAAVLYFPLKGGDVCVEVFGYDSSQHIEQMPLKRVWINSFLYHLCSGWFLGTNECQNVMFGTWVFTEMYWKMSRAVVTASVCFLCSADLTGAQDGSVRMFEWGHSQQITCFRSPGNSRVTRIRFNHQGNKVTRPHMPCTLSVSGRANCWLPPCRCHAILSFGKWLYGDARLSDSETFSHFVTNLPSRRTPQWGGCLQRTFLLGWEKPAFWTRVLALS